MYTYPGIEPPRFAGSIDSLCMIWVAKMMNASSSSPEDDSSKYQRESNDQSLIASEKYNYNIDKNIELAHEY
jgi:hypothetical protein